MARCMDCGNITLFNVTIGKEAAPSRQWRESRDPTSFELQHCEACPRCFQGLFEFLVCNDEMVQHIDQERKCEKFVKWTPGLEPKDYAALAAHEAIERRAEFHRWIGYAVSAIVAIVTAYITVRFTK